MRLFICISDSCVQFEMDRYAHGSGFACPRPTSLAQHPQSISHHQKACAHIREHGHPKSCGAEHGEHQEDGLDADGERDVLNQEARRVTRELNKQWNVKKVVVHQHYIGCFNGRVGGDSTVLSLSSGNKLPCASSMPTSRAMACAV